MQFGMDRQIRAYLFANGLEEGSCGIDESGGIDAFPGTQLDSVHVTVRYIHCFQWQAFPDQAIRCETIR